MLGKLLKYDFRATSKIMIGLFAGTFLVIIAGFILKLINIELLIGFYMFVAVIASAASLIVPYIVMIWRYYTNLFSREGYLTQTLPVDKTQIYIAKFIMSVTWFLCGLLSFICCLLMISHVLEFDISQIFDLIGSSEIFYSLVMYIIVIGGIQIVLGIAMIFFAITAANIPSLVNNNKLMAVVIYYAAYIIVSVADTVAILVFPFGIDIFTGKIVTKTMISQVLTNSAEVSILGMGTAITDLILTVLLIYFTITLLKKKVALK